MPLRMQSRETRAGNTRPDDGCRSQPVRDHVRGISRGCPRSAVHAVAKAAELIDLRRHTGVHPRIGATDVLPFIPVEGVSMEECVDLAHTVGEEIWGRLGIPVYFYEKAARRPERERLEKSGADNSKRYANSPQPTPAGGRISAGRNSTSPREQRSSERGSF